MRADLCLCLHLYTDVSFFFYSLKQTNGYDGDVYGSQTLNRRSGRVSIVNLHDTKCEQVATKFKEYTLLNLASLLFFFSVL